MRLARSFAFVLALALLDGTALAQSKGPNGGAVVKAGHHPVEFVSAGTELVFYLSGEDGKAVQTKGLSARATIQEGGKTKTVTLAPAEPNKLVGTLEAPLEAGARIVLSTRVHDHALQARFVKQ